LIPRLGSKPEEKEEKSRTSKDARTIGDSKTRQGGQVEDKKIEGMHSNIKGFK